YPYVHVTVVPSGLGWHSVGSVAAEANAGIVSVYAPTSAIPTVPIPSLRILRVLVVDMASYLSTCDSAGRVVRWVLAARCQRCTVEGKENPSNDVDFTIFYN